MASLPDQMISCGENPLASEHDQQHLLMLGAKEIRHLYRVIEAKNEMIQHLHETNVEMQGMLKAGRPDPNAPLYLIGVLFVAILMVTIWLLI
jgi:hypothetical protein